MARLADELDAGLEHPVIGGLEVVDAQEQSDAAGELIADRSGLPVAVRPREQQRGGCARRPDDDPAFPAPLAAGQRRRVLDQLKPETVDEEPDRLVVVVDDEGGLLDVHPPDGSGRTSL